MSEFNPNEIIQIFKTMNNNEHLNSKETEVIIEKYTLIMLETLSQIKRGKDDKLLTANDRSIIESISNVLKAMNNLKINTVKLVLSNSLLKHFLSEKIFIVDNEQFINENATEPYLLEIVKTAEEWIRVIKTIFSKINTDPRTFQEEKVFWASLYLEINTLIEFSLSEEYLFVTNSLKRVGKLSTLYTLQSLISDTRALRLCEKFKQFFQPFDFSFLPTILIDTIDYSQVIKDKYIENGFIKNCLTVIEQLKSTSRQPRVIRRSLSNNMNKFREDILKNILINFSSAYLEVFLSFDALAVKFNIENEKDADESRILIEKIDLFEMYITDLKQIQKCYMLKEITQYNEDQINNLLGKLKQAVLNSILKGEELFNNVIIPADQTQTVIADIESYDAVKITIQLVVFDFINKQIQHLQDLVSHITKFSAFIQFETFSKSIKDYLETTVNLFSEEILKLDLKNKTELIFANNQSNEFIVSNVDKITKIAEILAAFEVFCMVFKAKSVITNQILFLKDTYNCYFTSLPTDIKDIMIFQHSIPTGVSVYDQIQAIESSKISITDIKMNDIKIFLVDEKVNYCYPAFSPIYKDLVWIKPRYEELKKVLEEYNNMNRVVILPNHNASALTSSIPDSDEATYTTVCNDSTVLENATHSYFISQRLEDLIKSLVYLKWKYISDTILEEISLEFLKAQETYLMYKKITQDVCHVILPKLLKNKQGINAKVLKQHLLGFDEEILTNVLNYSRSYISEQILENLKCLIESKDIRVVMHVSRHTKDNMASKKGNFVCDIVKITRKELQSNNNTKVNISLHNTTNGLDYVFDINTLNESIVIESVQIFDEIIREYRICDVFVDTNLRCGLLNVIETHVCKFKTTLLNSFYLSEQKQKYNDVFDDAIILMHKIETLLASFDSFNSISKLILFDVTFIENCFNYINHIDTAIKELNAVIKQLKHSITAELNLLCSNANTSLLDRFFTYSKLKYFAYKTQRVCTELSNLNKSDAEKKLQNLDIEMLIIHDKIEQQQPLAEVRMLKYLISSFYAPLINDVKRVESLYNFKFPKTLSKNDIVQITELRETVESSIDKHKMKACDFEGDEVTFTPVFNNFTVEVEELYKHIEIFNQLLLFYEFKPIVFTLDLKSIEDEFLFAFNKKQYLQDHYNLPVKNNPIAVTSQDFSAEIKTRFGKKIKREISNLIKPVSYISELSKDYITTLFFDSGISLEKYLDCFNEEQIIETIEKAKYNYKITEYIKKQKLYHEIKVEGKDILLIVNYEDIIQHLTDAKSEYDLAFSFNKFNMYAEELKAIEEQLCYNLSFIKRVILIQDKIIEFNKLFKSEGMEIEKLRYGSLKEMFKTLITRMTKNIEEITDLTVLCISIEQNVKIITNSIHSSLHQMRTSCSRLYFISNEDLMQGMVDLSCRANIIKQIFHITDLIIENNNILGVTAGTEQFSLKFKIPFDQKLETVIFNLSNTLKLTLVESFVFHISNELSNTDNAVLSNVKAFIAQQISLETNDKYTQGSETISVVEELAVEFKYFNKYSKNTSYRIERILEYAKDNAEYLTIYPKPILDKYFLAGKDIESNSQKSAKIYNFLKLGLYTYEFEYYPPTDFIFTSLTAKIFANIFLSHNKSGMILYGPSGTGKTESVKYFCRTIGKPLFVFCCNEKCDYESLKNIIVGCAITSNYICFDEFNRLRKEVMSSVTELILEYKDKIKIFLTMNLGYRGRSELPKSLKYIFGEVYVSNPNIKDIIFYHTKSDKIFNLLESLKSSCSQDPSYDFGLRAVKSIFTKSELAHPNVSNDILNLVYFYMANFNNRDRQLLLSNIKRLIGLGLENTTLDFSYENIFKIALSSRNGIIILGNTGKSSLTYKMKNIILENSNKANNAINKSMYTDETKHKRFYKYNPINILLTNDSIFGSINKATKEWENSIFLSDLRVCLTCPCETWFVFDGPIKSEWIEDFNCLFDDNRVVCLPSGERIKIPFCFKFIFETRDIHEATPATLTRMYLIKSDNIEVGPKLALLRQDRDELSPQMYKNAKLLSNQLETLIDLERGLKDSNIVICSGLSGYGKKTIIKQLDPNYSVLYTDNLLGFIKDTKLVIIERFEEASISLQQQVKELWEYGTIGNVQYDDVKIVCCTTKHDSSFLSLIPRVSLENVKNIENFLANEINMLSSGSEFVQSNYEIVYKLTYYIYKTLSLSIGSLTKFISLIHLQYCTGTVTLADYLYFIIEIVFGENRHLKSYITKITNLPVNILLFDQSLKFIKAENFTYFAIIRSRILFLFHLNKSITLRGKRLSGKRTLINQCKELLKKDIKMFTWENTDKIRQLNYKLDTDTIYAFVLLNELDPAINNNFLTENTFEILFENFNVIVDLHKAKKGHSLYSSLVSCKQILNEKTSKCVEANTESNNLVEITSTWDQVFDRSLERIQNFIEFDNFFKATSFYYNLKITTENFRNAYEQRVQFLSNGLKAIVEFELAAADLETSIKSEKLLLEDKRNSLFKAIASLAIERKYLEESKSVMKVDQQKLNSELSIFEQKKKLVENMLEKAEELMEESKRCISQLTKAQLSEIKSMSNPPEIFQKTIEYVYLLLENSTKGPEWSFLQGYLKSNDFISKVTSFKLVDSQMTNFIIKSFLNVYSIDKSEKVSKTCYALHNWINAIVKQHQTQNEVIPLRAELQSLKSNLDAFKSKLSKKEDDLKHIVTKAGAIENDKLRYEQESITIEKTIIGFTDKLEVLKKVINNFKIEREQWKYVAFRSPVAYLLDKNNVIEFAKEIYIDTNTFNNEKFVEYKKSFVEISVDSTSFTNAIANTVFFKNDILIKDVVGFNPTIYSLIKQINDRYIDQSRFLESDKSKQQQVIIQGLHNNCYMEETYTYLSTTKFKIDRKSNLEPLENGLLEHLNSRDMCLQSILDHQILLKEERDILMKEKAQEELYKLFNTLYEQINHIFTAVYEGQFPFDVYKEFIDLKQGVYSNITQEITSFFQYTFRYKLLCETNNILLYSQIADNSYFSVSEVNQYSFDYTFITDFNDIFLELNKMVKIDIEISAGSPENNNKIGILLTENSGKTVLVKNIQFLPTCIKTGTNRFIYTISKNEKHSLIASTRIVYLDKNSSFDIIFNSLKDLMKRNTTTTAAQEKLIRFHSLGVSLSYDFSIRDLETAMDNSDLGYEFITESLYFSKFAAEEQIKIRSEMSKLN